jgi:hypothetical protein
MMGEIIVGTMTVGVMNAGAIMLITIDDATAQVARDTHSVLNPTNYEVKTSCRNASSSAPPEE